MALGALLEVLLVIANVGTAVVLFPILKRQDEGLALGYVAARLVECTFIAIAIGIGSLLAVVRLRQDLAQAAGGDSGSIVTVGRSLVAIHDWTFLLGRSGSVVPCKRTRMMRIEGIAGLGQTGGA